MMTCEAALKRVPNPSGSPAITAARAVTENGIECTPIWPVNAQDAQRLVSLAPHEVAQVFCALDVSVTQGNYWIQDDKEYPVVAVEEWQPPIAQMDAIKRVILHKVKAKSAS